MPRKNAAYMYFFFVALLASKSGLLLRNVDRRAANAGRALPAGDSCDGLPLSSFNNRGWPDRPSVGLCMGGLVAAILLISSPSSDSASLSNAPSTPVPVYRISPLMGPWCLEVEPRTFKVRGEGRRGGRFELEGAEDSEGGV